MMETARQLGQKIHEQGGKAFFVGGTVRDNLMGMNPNDIDIEVFNLSQDALEAILATFGEVNLVGKSFGVYKMGELDIALPRTERKTGTGHKGFTIEPNPFLPIKDAMRRRDFTINAIYQNVVTNELVDEFNGLNDLAHDRICIVDRNTFLDDSLRVLRACQFVSRFGFSIDSFDVQFMRGVDLSDLPAERVLGEIEKLLLGKFVKQGLIELDNTGALSQLFPELDILRNIPQDPFWHQEGNVFIHTLMVMDVASKLIGDLTRAEKLTVMLACLFHDLGKATTTEVIDGRVKAHGHAEAGVPIALELLSRLNVHTVDGFDVRNNVLSLVDKHLMPAHLKGDAKDSAFRRLSTKVNVKLLSIVSRADVLGRGGEVNADVVDAFDSRIARLDIVDNPIKPILMGRHLIEMGMKPSAKFSAILKAVFEKQLNGTVTNLEEALKEVEIITI